jgi:release factor glutamine methyltransferase
MSAEVGGPTVNDGERGFARASQLYSRHLDDRETPAEFDLLGRTWTLVAGVFAPVHTPVTGLFTSWLTYPRGGQFLEMGCGAGVTAVTAALSGCFVTALDISEAAVCNTRLNAARQGVADLVQARHSDLFDALDASETFDMIFWNSNFALPPLGYTVQSDLEQAFFDPGYKTHRRFLEQAPSRLNGGGKVLLGFSDLGSWTDLRVACSEAGLVPQVVRSQRHSLGVPIEFQLVELVRAVATSR